MDSPRKRNDLLSPRIPDEGSRTHSSCSVLDILMDMSMMLRVAGWDIGPKALRADLSRRYLTRNEEAPRMVRINFARLRNDLEALGNIGRIPEGGVWRSSFSEADMEA